VTSWTPEALPDLSGAQAVVTGANSGIGWFTALELGRRGAQVVLACRSVERGEEAAGRLRAEVPGASFEVRRLDLADLSSVREFAEGYPEGALDLLCLNAGVMALPPRKTADGFEMQMGTNHFGHFALAGLLLGRLQNAVAARVVTVTSLLHRRGKLDLDDLDGARGYHKWRQYNASKLANLMFALQLQARLQRAESTVRSLAAHPGYAATNLQFAGPTMEGSLLGKAWSWVGNTFLAQSAEKGAWPSLYALAAPEAEAGALYGPDGPYELWGCPTVCPPAAQALDEEAQVALWEASVARTGVDFDSL
jgi:NAD(P)-dependent dehydrogenase (short-subunit alcohol dehydrogenase family)